MKNIFNIFLSGIVKFFRNGLFLNMQIDLPWFLGNKISTTYKDYWRRKIDLNSVLPVKNRRLPLLQAMSDIELKSM